MQHLSTKDNERNLCQDLLAIENADSDLKVHALHRRRQKQDRTGPDRITDRIRDRITDRITDRIGSDPGSDPGSDHGSDQGKKFKIQNSRFKSQNFVEQITLE